MAKTQTQTQTQTTKSVNKSASNTPIIASFDTYVAKVTDSKKANALKEVHAKKQAKKDQTKKGVFALVAGTIATIEHKGLKKAIDYHCKQGNLCKVETGVKLTAQGATLWNAERVAPNADKFQKIAAFVHGGANLPEFGGERKTPVKVGGSRQLPSLEFWGSFATANMRLCFASIWASK